VFEKRIPNYATLMINVRIVKSNMKSTTIKQPIYCFQPLS